MPPSSLASSRVTWRRIDCIGAIHQTCRNLSLYWGCLLDAVGGCDLTIQGNTVQDYDLWLRCAERCEFGFVAEPVSRLGLHDSQGLWNRSEMLTQLLQVLFAHLPESEWRRWPQGRERLAQLYGSLASAHLDEGDKLLAQRSFGSAFGMDKSRSSLLKYAATFLPISIIRKVQSLRTSGGPAT